LFAHGSLVVAEASNIVIGYAAAIRAGASQHVSDLFVHQDARGLAIGRKLLDAVWDAGAAGMPRQTFSSLHSAALPLYAGAIGTSEFTVIARACLALSSVKC
jgi:GNAT superfamily N-acetyltransferase